MKVSDTGPTPPGLFHPAAMRPSDSLHVNILRFFYPLCYLNRKLDGVISQDVIARLERIGRRVRRIRFFGINLAGTACEIECVNVFLAGLPIRVDRHGSPVVVTDNFSRIDTGAGFGGYLEFYGQEDPCSMSYPGSIPCYCRISMALPALSDSGSVHVISPNRALYS